MMARMNQVHRLAVYGSLAPGRPNHQQLARLHGVWFPGVVRGRLLQAGWGAWIGYPGLVLDADGTIIEVQVFESADLTGHWSRLDDFEGAAYQRVSTTIHTEAGAVAAHIYVLRDGLT
jgi:gamma-glutamylcyclotransferase (GGCT)/AIG2-like uncharacterized protein YtfP